MFKEFQRAKSSVTRINISKNKKSVFFRYQSNFVMTNFETLFIMKYQQRPKTKK